MKLIKWLYQKPNKWDNDITNKKISDELFLILINWINNQEDLLITSDIEVLKINFYLYLNNCQTRYYYSDYEYFNLKYCDKIVDLFLKFKDITKIYGSMILYDKNNNSNDLLDFIHSYCEIIEEDEEDDYDEEKLVNLWE
jgi:hypothetical protein|tara:strand:- start:86 stop:505 length:420 start_codon:yes stop_codon:yes gene_type:complete